MPIINNYIKNADGFSYTEKIENLNFTKINNNIYFNPFIQLYTIFCIRQLIKKENIPEEEKSKKLKDTNQHIKKCWNEFIDKYTI